MDEQPHLDSELPWLSHYPRGIDWHASFPKTSLPALLWETVARFGDRPCLDFLGKRWRYREIGDLIKRAAKGFIALGVDKGTRVALVLPNSPYYVIAYYGVLEAGGTVVNVNPLYSESELRHLIADSGAAIIVTLDVNEIYGKLAAISGTASLRKIVVGRMAAILPPLKSLAYRLFRRRDIANVPQDDRHVDFAALLDNDGRIDPPAIDPEKDVALLQYTGGTTGTPKGAMLTHHNLVANTLQCRAWFPDGVPGEERVVAVLPFFHVFAMTVALNLAIAEGAKIVLLPRFEMASLLAALKRHRPTTFAGVPTLFTALGNDPRAAQIDFSAMKSCISGGAPLPVEIKSKFEALARCPLVEGYGLSETSPVVACNPLHGVNKPGSVGLPLPATSIRITAVDDPAQQMAMGERGEVLVQGPQVMKGYWANPEATAEVFHDGWLRTGDVGYLDPDGYIFLVDRIKDVIIAGGYKIYPRNVEEVIYQFQGVAECIVIGVDDPYRGQTVKAFIAPAPGQHIDETALRAFLKTRLSPMEMPKLFEFRETLPKTLIGKPSRMALLKEETQKAGKPTA